MRLEAIGTTSRAVERGIGAETGKVLLRVLQQCEAIYEEQINQIKTLLQEEGLVNISIFNQAG